MADHGPSVPPDIDAVVFPKRLASCHISRTAPVFWVSPRCKHINTPEGSYRIVLACALLAHSLPAYCREYPRYYGTRPLARRRYI